MSFEIIITKTRETIRKSGKDWTKVGQEETQSTYDPDKIHLTDKYGYTPEIEKAVIEKVDVLRQTIDELDLSAVIKAINKL